MRGSSPLERAPASLNDLLRGGKTCDVKLRCPSGLKRSSGLRIIKLWPLPIQQPWDEDWWEPVEGDVTF